MYKKRAQDQIYRVWIPISGFSVIDVKALSEDDAIQKITEGGGLHEDVLDEDFENIEWGHPSEWDIEKLEE